MNLHKLKIGLLISTIGLLSLSPTPIKGEETITIEEEPLTLLEAAELWRRPRLIQSFIGHEGAVNALTFSPDGDIVVSGGSSNDPTLKFWSVATGKQVERIRAQRTAVMEVAISPNGATLVSTGEDAGINIWDWQTGEFLFTFFEHGSNILSMVISPDSSVMVTGGLDGIRVWNLIPQRPIFILDGIGNPTYALAMHPNGYVVASGHQDGVVRFWNLRTTKELSEFILHDNLVSGLAFTPDGNKLITSSYDGTIKVWDLVTQQLLFTMTGHRSIIRAIALNPDGQVLASAGNDGVRLWNIETGEFLGVASGHTDWVQSLAFSNDGRRLATGGFDRIIRIWEIPEAF
ncbi:MAG: WD40 repeat domain-containing protein [Gloeocapsa sp. DLM2.Bin57]|nr:MAG: WD40 repeat domain-containing protein [Gloeocapsa sp. DLM2.Bin57]